MDYYAIFGYYRSNDVGVCRSLKIWENWVKKHDNTYVQTSSGKIESAASRLSRSLKVIETDTDPSGINDFLLLISCSYGSILYRLALKRKLFILPEFKAPAKGLSGCQGRRSWGWGS